MKTNLLYKSAANPSSFGSTADHPQNPAPLQPGRGKIERILAFLDTPNLYYSFAECSGGDFVPDYDELLAIARTRGSLVAASALVNDGFPDVAADALRRRGYNVARSEGRDCDFRFIAEAIA